MEHFWGNLVSDIPRLIWKRLENGKVFQLSISGWGKRKKDLRLEEIVAVDMVCVNYSGSGKYDENNKCVMWDDAPKLQDSNFDQLIDPTDAPKMQFDAALKGDQTSGWWPCAAVSWKTEAEDMGCDADQGTYRSMKLQGAAKTWIICWYQLFDTSDVLVLWNVILTAPPSRL